MAKLKKGDTFFVSQFGHVEVKEFASTNPHGAEHCFETPEEAAEFFKKSWKRDDISGESLNEYVLVKNQYGGTCPIREAYPGYFEDME